MQAGDIISMLTVVFSSAVILYTVFTACAPLFETDY